MIRYRNYNSITGVNPGVELHSARVLDAKREAPVGRIVEAIDWATGQDVDIINMRSRGYDSPG